MVCMDPRQISRQKRANRRAEIAFDLGSERNGQVVVQQRGWLPGCRRVPDPDKQLTFGSRDGRQSVQGRIVGPIISGAANRD